MIARRSFLGAIAAFFAWPWGLWKRKVKDEQWRPAGAAKPIQLASQIWWEGPDGWYMRETYPDGSGAIFVWDGDNWQKIAHVFDQSAIAQLFPKESV
jgi:hypothetical protein